MIKLIAGFFKSPKKGSIAGEMARSVNITTSRSREIHQSFKDVKKDADARREKPYSFRPEGTQKDFEREFLNLRIVVSIYLSLFIGCISIAALGVYDHIEQMTEFMYVISMIGLVQYIKYIRDVFRCRKISRNWELRNEPLSMSWKAFFKEVVENPLRLIPLF